MKLFCMDLHISVIADFKSIFRDVEIVDWCLSGHAWVFGRRQDNPAIINPKTWEKLDETMITNFQAHYDTFLQEFDGFIVGYAGGFAMIYEKYNKPIFMLNAVRYDIPFCFSKDVAMRKKYNECLARLYARKLLTIVSNNRGDQEYTRLGCGVQPEYLPSLCLYTRMRYTPTKDTFFVYNWTCQESLPDHPLLTKRSGPFAWNDLASYKGIVIFPYEISLMSLFEQFSAGIPMFFPSKTFMKKSHRLISNEGYWGSQLLDEYKSCTNDFWIEHSDMYTTFLSPNTFYFDSVSHLFELLRNFKYVDDFNSRQAYIANVKAIWASWFKRVFPNNKKWSAEQSLQGLRVKTDHT